MRNIVKVTKSKNKTNKGRSSLLRKKKLESTKDENPQKSCRLRSESCFRSELRECETQCKSNKINRYCYPIEPFPPFFLSYLSSIEGTCVQCLKDSHCHHNMGCNVENKTCTIERVDQGPTLITNQALEIINERITSRMTIVSSSKELKWTLLG